MKLPRSLLAPLFLMIFLGTPLSAQVGPPKSLAVLPFSAIGIDSVYVQSSESILRLELQKQGAIRLISLAKMAAITGNQICSEIPCALDIGERLSADRAAVVKLVGLGDKIIVQYMLLDVPRRKTVLLDQLTAASVEDLDMVMKRLAVSIAREIPADQAAEVGLITEQETLEPRRRSGRKFVGVSFGYLFPQNGYDNEDRVFAMEFRSGVEIKDYAVGMQLAVRKGFAMNVFGSYLMTKTDVCPYLGGAFGFHWVSHHDYYYYSYSEDSYQKKSDGFELTANGGLLLLRTYNTQIIINLAYTYTLNDYDDSALVFTIGLQK